MKSKGTEATEGTQGTQGRLATWWDSFCNLLGLYDNSRVEISKEELERGNRALREVAGLREESERRGKRILALNEVVEFRRELSGVGQHDILDALKLTDPTEPLWLAVQRAMELQFKRELESALAPGQSAEDRAFNNGRAAAVEDLRTMLLQMWAKARV